MVLNRRVVWISKIINVMKTHNSLDRARYHIYIAEGVSESERGREEKRGNMNERTHLNFSELKKNTQF